MSSFRALVLAATGMNAQQTFLQVVVRFAEAEFDFRKQSLQAGSACFEISRMAI